MRVVMVTPDIVIDRRIILEAKSLVETGKEVIIVASWAEGLEEYEIVDQIKIHRVKYNGVDPRYRWVYQFQGILIHLINVLSNLVNRGNTFNLNLFNRGLNKLSTLASGFFNLIIRILNTAIRALAWGTNRILNLLGRLGNKIIGLWARGCVFGFGLAAKTINKITALTAKSLSKLHAMSGYEYHVMKVVQKYEGDVYHAHDLPVLRSTAEAAANVNAKVVYDAHELYTEIGELSPSYRAKLSKVEKKYIAAVDATITVNEFISDEMANRYNIKAPYVLYNSTIRPSSFDINRRYDKFREKWPELAEKKIVLYQGWFSLYRNLLQLVESAQFVNDDICLVFMGYGEERTVLEQRCKELGIADKVYFMDAVSQEVLLQYSASADAGIIPYPPVDMNHYYCSPNKLFEFMQAGLPIIASDLPFLSKIIDGYGIGVTAKLDSPEAFAKAINRFFEQGDVSIYRERLQRAADDFSWSNDARKLLNIYEKL